MFLFRVANGAGEKVTQPLLPLLLPRIQRERGNGSVTQTIQSDGGKKTCPFLVEPLDTVVAEVILAPRPRQTRRRANKPVKDKAVLRHDLMHKPAKESFAWLILLEPKQTRGCVIEGRLISGELPADMKGRDH